MQPKISVIIPVYNVENYLRECLNSVINQTLRDIEIICVNNGSTDGSLAILKEYAIKDNRIKIVCQDNVGAGTARNIGLKLAKGEYLSFLDSDDFFDHTMLEKSYNKALENKVDIVVFGAYIYDTNTKNQECLYSFNKIHSQTYPFSYKDITVSIFKAFNNVAWNKIFRRDFILRNGIAFQEIKRVNDLFFTWSSILSAEKIDIVDESLLYYRTGLSKYLQFNKEKPPLEIYYALKELRKYLLKNHKYDELKDKFKKYFLDCILGTLFDIKNNNSFSLLCNELKSHILSEFEIDNSIINFIDQETCGHLNFFLQILPKINTFKGNIIIYGYNPLAKKLMQHYADRVVFVVDNYKADQKIDDISIKKLKDIDYNNELFVITARNESTIQEIINSIKERFSTAHWVSLLE